MYITLLEIRDWVCKDSNKNEIRPSTDTKKQKKRISLAEKYALF
jgi:hypothetical protein